MSEFDYFAPTPIQTSIERAVDREYTPISALQHGSPIEFSVAGSDRVYMDVNKCTLYIKAKITNALGGALANGTTVGPINNTLDSLWSHVGLDLCGTELSDPNGLYAYRAYLENLISYNKDVKDTQLQLSLWAKDTAGSMNITTPGGANVGLTTRAAYFGVNEVEMIGRPHIDLFFQPLLIPSNCSMKIKFIPNKDKFILKSAAPLNNVAQVEYRLVIVEARLLIPTVEVSHSLALAHEKILHDGTNARFHYKRPVLKYLSVPAGQTTTTHNNIYSGRLPERIFLVMVSDASMAGHYQHNPFNFQHFNANNVALYVDSEMIPSRAFTPDFANARYAREYNNLFEVTGTLLTKETVDISRQEFGNGFTVWAFDLTVDKGCERCKSNTRSGVVRVEIKFAAATAETINIICYGEYNAFIELDKNRNVIKDF